MRPTDKTLCRPPAGKKAEDIGKPRFVYGVRRVNH